MPQVYGNERVVQQGEEWPLDILLSQSNSEYIPFIVSSERENPMWAITVASTKYEKNERYVATWWLDLSQGDGPNQKPLPRFYQTVPQYVDELSDHLSVRPDGDKPMEALYQYTLISDEVDLDLGHKRYYYVYFTEEDPNTPVYDYECRIRMQFESEDTVQWGSQNYMYQITLVDTISMADWIQSAKATHPDLPWPEWVQRTDPTWDKPIQEPGEDPIAYNKRVEASWRIFNNNWIMNNRNELFMFIKNRIPNWFQTDIDIDAPVGKLGIPQYILPPTKLQVNNNLRKLI